MPWTASPQIHKIVESYFWGAIITPWALLGVASRRRAQGCNSSYIEEWVGLLHWAHWASAPHPRGGRNAPLQGTVRLHSGQRPISVEYQIYLPAIDTQVIGMRGSSITLLTFDGWYVYFICLLLLYSCISWSSGSMCCSPDLVLITGFCFVFWCGSVSVLVYLYS